MNLTTLLPSLSRRAAPLLLLAASCLLSACNFGSSQVAQEDRRERFAARPPVLDPYQSESDRILTAYIYTYRYDICGYPGFGKLAREYIVKKIKECYPEAASDMSQLTSEAAVTKFDEKLREIKEHPAKSDKCEKDDSFEERIKTANFVISATKEVLEYKKYGNICDNIFLH